MRGRKPLATSLHVLRGTYHATKHGRDRAGEPVAEGEIPDAPDWMSDSQRQIWADAVDNAPLGVLKACDAGILTVWVIAADQHQVASLQQAKLDAGASLPLMSVDRNGTPLPSPYLGIINKAALVMLKAGSELGFSPSTRPRMVGSPGKAEPSPWDEIDRPLQALPSGRAN